MDICQNIRLQKVNFTLQNTVNQDAKNTIYMQSLPAALSEWGSFLLSNTLSIWGQREGYKYIHSLFYILSEIISETNSARISHINKQVSQ